MVEKEFIDYLCCMPHRDKKRCKSLKTNYFTLNMDNGSRQYIAIDLKSFYASVECVDRGLDPLTTNLVVADESRTQKTICLAVSPSLKAYGVGGRPRLFEVVQKVNEIYRQTGEKIEYITAPPRMNRYMEVSAQIYQIYLHYVAAGDIHVYSCDEVFMDVTHYLGAYKLTAHELAIRMIRDVLSQTGITATAGIGTNLYLCKVAMDIVAKHKPADKDGVRIAELDEQSYREQLWNHRPITDFWRVGHGIANRLAQYGIDTMGKLARASLTHEDLLYKTFGINAELLIDHAWGWEPCTMEEIKRYRPTTNSLSNGQVLAEPYTFAKARVVVEEMADFISLSLVEKCMVTDQMGLYISYASESLTDPKRQAAYRGEVVQDRFGRRMPKPAGGTINLPMHTSSSRIIIDSMLALYDRIVDPKLMIKRINIATNHVISEEAVAKKSIGSQQLDLFADYEALEEEKRHQDEALAKERRMQEALIHIKKQFGKNAILRGVSFAEGATGKERNRQVGGHKA